MVSLGAHTRHKWNPNAKSTAITLLSLIAHSTKPWLMSFSKDEGRFLHFSVDKLWQNNLIYCNWYTLLLRLCSLLYVCFCEEFCFFVFNSLMRISINLLHRYSFFPYIIAPIFIYCWQNLAGVQFLIIITSLQMFLFQ